METPLLSVCIICYNQAEFIEQAIESVIAQKVDFTFEIIIADDYSTDGTQQIVAKYQTLYPDLITVLPRDINLGAVKNFTDLIKSAKGKYVAYLEGDDYWTIHAKLQQQIDFLEKNADFTICFTSCHEIFSESPDDSRNFINNGSGNRETTTINDLIFRNYIQTCTVVFKNNLFGEFPVWYHELKMGDWPLHLLNAQFGKIKYLPIVSAIHRNHSTGVWSTRTTISKIQQTLAVYDCLQTHTEFYNLKNFKKAKSNLHFSSVKYYLKEGKILQAVSNFIKGFFLYPLPYKKPV